MERSYILFRVDCERWGDNRDNIAEIVFKTICKQEDLPKNLFYYFFENSDGLDFLEILSNLLEYNKDNEDKKDLNEIKKYLNEEIELKDEDVTRIKNNFQINGLNLLENIEKNVGLMKVFDKFDYGCNRLFLIEDPTGIINKMKRNGFLIY